MTRGITIPRDLFESLAFRQLPPLEYRLLVELIALQQDSKTDGVRCSARWAAKVCGLKKSAAHDALRCLEERGFIVRILARHVSAVSGRAPDV
jgi:DNA-binding MarR family transcriptional regulator